MVSLPCLWQQQPGKENPRPVAGAELEPAAVLTPTSTGGSRGERPSRHPPREVTRKRWDFCCRSLALPQAQKLPENLHQPQHIPPSRDSQTPSKGITASSVSHRTQHLSEGAGASEEERR